MYLEKINGPEDVKKIKIDELPVLALLAVDVSHVIKHYAAKARIEPNHKIDSAS